MATHTTTLASPSDLVLLLQTNYGVNGVNVSKDVLCEASGFFARALDGKFSEGVKYREAVQKGEQHKWRITEGDTYGFTLMLAILHEPNHDHQRITVDNLHRIAILADKYACVPTMQILLLPACRMHVEDIRTCGKPWDSPETNRRLNFAAAGTTYPDKDPAVEVSKLLLTLHLLEIKEQFILLFQFIVLSCKSPPVLEVTVSVHDDELLKISEAIEKRWNAMWERLKYTLDEMVATMFEFGESLEAQYDKETQVQETWEGHDRRKLTMPSRGCVVFAMKQQSMLSTLWKRTSWPQLDRRSSIYCTLLDVQDILQACPGHDAQVRVHRSAEDLMTEEGLDPHTARCALCAHGGYETGEWEKFLVAAQEEACSFCVKCLSTAEECQDRGDCGGHEQIQVPPWAGGTFMA